MADLPAEQRCQLCRETAANYVVEPDTLSPTDVHRRSEQSDVPANVTDVVAGASAGQKPRAAIRFPEQL